MRLVHSTTLLLHEFTRDEIPPYAILSHTWGEGEVSFQDMDSEEVYQKIGYDKIKHCCSTVRADGFEYVWIDTCCIDKRSSSELSEAINSMYRWYHEAEVCYAYLSDVSADGDPCVSGSDFSKSRWFTRGWTLQELIAPSTVIFLDGEWNEIGTKSSLQDVTENVTGIHMRALSGDIEELRTFSVAQRMSWAAKRETTRTEDLAYCLMGLFEVNMPMLYGEGEHAFIRLQEEIIKSSDDPTIFAWRSDIVWDFKGVLLAPSPSRFLTAGSIIRSEHQNSTSFTLSNKGVHIQLRSFHLDDQLDQPGALLGVLDCHDANKPGLLLGIFLQVDEANKYAYRVYCDRLGMMLEEEASALEIEAVYVQQLPQLDFKRLFRRYKTYRIRAAAIQDQYPPGFIESDGTIPQKSRPGTNIMGAVKVAVNENSCIVVLRGADDALSANIATHLPNESLEGIVRSFDTGKRVWIDEPDRIMHQMPSGGYFSVKIRKMIVSGERTLIVDVDV